MVPFTRDRDQVLSGLRSTQARDLPNRLGDGIRTARALVGPDPRAEIHAFTDGAHPEALKGQGDDVRVRWVGVGQRARNVAITNLAIRRNYFGSFDSQAFLSVVNFSDTVQTLSFTLHLDNDLIAEKSLSLEPNVRRAVVLPFSHPGGGVVRARLNVTDDLEADNAAYAVIPPPRDISVLLVSSGNLFLEKVLKSDPQVKMEVRTPTPTRAGCRASTWWSSTARARRASATGASCS